MRRRWRASPPTRPAFKRCASLPMPRDPYLTDESGLPPHVNGTVITVGTFDGVHRGHRDVVERLVDRSRVLKIPSVLVTFEPHPLEIVNPAAAPGSRSDRKSTRLNSSHLVISYAVFCLKKKKKSNIQANAARKYNRTDNASNSSIDVENLPMNKIARHEFTESIETLERKGMVMPSCEV